MSVSNTEASAFFTCLKIRFSHGTGAESLLILLHLYPLHPLQGAKDYQVIKIGNL